MHIQQIQRRFETLGRARLEYRLGPPASEAAIDAAEARLGVVFPSQVRKLYEAFDGIEVVQPAFRVYALAEMVREGPLLEFALFDHVHRVAFDTSERNVRDQWFVVNAQTGYRITYTMASFWSIRMWSWIQYGVPIWYDFHGEGQAE